MRMNEAFNCRIINISQHFRPRTFNMFQNDPVLKVSSSSVFVGALWWWRALWWWLRGKHRQGSHVRVFANSRGRSVHTYMYTHTYNLHIIILYMTRLAQQRGLLKSYQTDMSTLPGILVTHMFHPGTSQRNFSDYAVIWGALSSFVKWFLALGDSWASWTILVNVG